MVNGSIPLDGLTVPDGIGGLNNEVIVTDQNTRESAKRSPDLPKTEASRPSMSVETSENDSAENSGNDGDGTKPEPKMGNDSLESSSVATDTAQKSASVDEAEASAKPSQKIEESTSTKQGDGDDKVKTPPELSPNAGAKVSTEKNDAADKAEASPQKGEAVTSTKKSETDKPGSADNSSTTKRPRPAAKNEPAKSLEATMVEDVVPKLASTLGKENGLSDIDVSFEENQLKVGFVKDGIPYCFWAFFPDGSLTGTRGSSLTSHGVPPSTIEPFLIDEKKITPELIVFWVTKRLYMQNLLSTN